MAVPSAETGTLARSVRVDDGRQIPRRGLARTPKALTLSIDIMQKGSPEADHDEGKLDNPDEVGWKAGHRDWRPGDLGSRIPPTRTLPGHADRRQHRRDSGHGRSTSLAKNPVTLEQLKALAREVLTHL